MSLQCWEEGGGGGGLFTAVPLGMVTGTGSGSELSASVGGSTDDNLIGSFSEGVGFDGGDSTEVCNVFSWQLVVSQLSSAQATHLSHLTCLRSSLYSLSNWVLTAKRGKVSWMKARREQTVLREGEGVVLMIGSLQLKNENSSPRSVNQATVTHTLDCKQLTTVGQNGQQQQKGINHKGSHF